MPLLRTVQSCAKSVTLHYALRVCSAALSSSAGTLMKWVGILDDVWMINKHKHSRDARICNYLGGAGQLMSPPKCSCSPLKNNRANDRRIGEYVRR